eukprot:TRINITY_DN4644_c0_g1_i4.p1 TRINITY_DN4644_c0_g1~~TRINITY_DN4644_c0_g1_i4.p1  ORF type:complete len:178 (-),score=25.77 TRINITY_DN4644_c0_g1_i4:183-716(-)
MSVQSTNHIEMGDETVVHLKDDDDIEKLLEDPEKLPVQKPPHLEYWMKRSKILTITEFVVLGTFSFVWSYLFTIPYCGFLFQCGCTWLWDGGIEPCNYKTPGMPHCPWCIAPIVLGSIPQWGTPFLMIGITCLLAYRWPHRRVLIYGLLPLAIWFGFNFILGGIFKLAYNYPYFLHT